MTSGDVVDDVVLTLKESRECVLRIAAERTAITPWRLVVVSLHGSTPERDSGPGFETSLTWPTSTPVEVPVPRPGRYRLVARLDPEGEAHGMAQELEIDVVHVTAEPRTVRIRNPWTVAMGRRR